VKWDTKLGDAWWIGEVGAHDRLETFMKKGIKNYKKGRDFPGEQYVSRLSPYLHWGEISPNTIWHRVSLINQDANTAHFKSELGWREFSYYLLYHFPYIPEKPLQKKFENFKWVKNDEFLRRWQKGLTGYPIVDAGMRQLWAEGYMHNRLRMIVASFLVKNLMLHWRHGERWFWDTLLDADLASNSAGWQWVAGCGADAAPYFRIFNPITQGEKFDLTGKYTKKWCPELANLPDKYLYHPWDAPVKVLKDAGIKLGQDYPHPIIDIKGSREKALAAFAALKN